MPTRKPLLSKRKKSMARKASKKAAKRARKKYREPGYYRRRGSGLLVPESTDGQSQLVPASKLEKGVADAKDRMKDIIYDIASTLDDEFELRDVEFQASFSADGVFLVSVSAGLRRSTCAFSESDAPQPSKRHQRLRTASASSTALARSGSMAARHGDADTGGSRTS